jgi:ATP-binding cassette subfamily F protein uup
MALLLSARNLAKRYGANPLFRDVSFTVSDEDRLGLIGPNGSGKSTVLEILAGRRDPDSGEVVSRKNTRLAYVAQQTQFEPGKTVRELVTRRAEASGVPEQDRKRNVLETLGRAGFSYFEAEANAMSGGWRKRLAIVEALVSRPDVLLLDEPTNHLDIEGIEWLEGILQSSSFACVVISHDRYFLENVATSMAELNRAYPDDLFQVPGNYSNFLEKKSDFLASQAKRQEALENRVRNEMEWLRRGPKARATKAKARIDNAHQLIRELDDMQARARTETAGVNFTATERRTKRLVEMIGVSYGYGDRKIIDGVDLTLTAGMRIGLVGPNGSGKTTLLRLLRGEFEPQAGEIRRAASLRIVYFDQNRPLDTTLTLRRALAPDSDSVVYQDRTIHVASWAARFLFSSEQLNQPVERLSGGERARVLIAKLMLEPADVLLLDEPTNDLDIPTLEILEENLSEFPGALVLVTHDRFMLDRVSTAVWGLDGQGAAGLFADYAQWEAWQAERAGAKSPSSSAEEIKDRTAPTTPPKRSKLSYMDSRDFETIEERISEAEDALRSKTAAMDDPLVLRDPQRLQTVVKEMEEAQQAVDLLYERWAELEAKSAANVIVSS